MEKKGAWRSIELGMNVMYRSFILDIKGKHFKVHESALRNGWVDNCMSKRHCCCRI